MFPLFLDNFFVSFVSVGILGAAESDREDYALMNKRSLNV